MPQAADCTRTPRELQAARNGARWPARARPGGAWGGRSQTCTDVGSRGYTEPETTEVHSSGVLWDRSKKIKGVNRLVKYESDLEPRNELCF